TGARTGVGGDAGPHGITLTAARASTIRCSQTPARWLLIMNRLADECSPYLREHSGNPVDWYPWGDEAFERARLDDKPVLLSVGYAACHWCHVMEHESFEDVETADRKSTRLNSSHRLLSRMPSSA